MLWQGFMNFYLFNNSVSMLSVHTVSVPSRLLWQGFLGVGGRGDNCVNAVCPHGGGGGQLCQCCLSSQLNVPSQMLWQRFWIFIFYIFFEQLCVNAVCPHSKHTEQAALARISNTFSTSLCQCCHSCKTLSLS